MGLSHFQYPLSLSCLVLALRATRGPRVPVLSFPATNPHRLSISITTIRPCVPPRGLGVPEDPRGPGPGLPRPPRSQPRAADAMTPRRSEGRSGRLDERGSETGPAAAVRRGR